MTSEQSEKQLAEAKESLASARELYGSADYDRVVEALLVAIKLISAAYTPEHEDVVHCYQLLGASYFELGRFTDAQNAYEKCYKLLEKHPQPDWPWMLEVQFSMACCDIKLNRVIKVESALSRLEKLAASHLPPDHPLVATIFAAHRDLTGIDSDESQSEIQTRQVRLLATKVRNPSGTKESVIKASPSQQLSEIEGFGTKASPSQQLSEVEGFGIKASPSQQLSETEGFGIKASENWQSTGAEGVDVQASQSQPAAEPKKARIRPSQSQQLSDTKELTASQSHRVTEAIEVSPKPSQSQSQQLTDPNMVKKQAGLSEQPAGDKEDLIHSPQQFLRAKTLSGGFSLDDLGPQAGEDQGTDPAPKQHLQSLRKADTLEQKAPVRPMKERLKESLPKLFGDRKITIPLLIIVVSLICFSSVFKQLGSFSFEPYLQVAEQPYYAGLYPLQVQNNQMSFMRALPMRKGDNTLPPPPEGATGPTKDQRVILTVEYVPIFNVFTLMRAVLLKHSFWMFCQPNGTLTDEKGNGYYVKNDDRYVLMEAMQKFAATVLNYRFKHATFPDQCQEGDIATQPHPQHGVLYTSVEDPYLQGVTAPTIKSAHGIVIPNVPPDKQVEALLHGAAWSDTKLKPGAIECLKFYPDNGGEAFFIHGAGKDGKLLSSKNGPQLFAFDGDNLMMPTKDPPLPAGEDMVVISAVPKSAITNYWLFLISFPIAGVLIIGAWIGRKLFKELRNKL